ncbi:MAG: glycosyl hydrolase family 28 protein [Planctomycetia bacterium]|nr:glycosyl hydrolase family 28 protein [Planctomycetia bacterium]
MHNSIKVKILDWSIRCLIGVIVVLSAIVIYRHFKYNLESRSPTGLYNVTTFGARGNATTLDTAAIQKAIDTCSRFGGGTVVFPAGIYLCGTLELKTNVMLQLLAGAEIFGAPDIKDYRTIDPFIDGDGQAFGYCLIGANHANNIGIEGPGTINGDGVGFRGDRPFLIRLAHCSGIIVRNVTLEQSAAWGLNLYRCRQILVKAVHIWNHANYNNDGIDVDSSELVHITHCDINSEDDCICFKTTTPTSCSHIRVDHCRLSSQCADVKFGSETMGTMRDIHVRDCYEYDTRLGGIKILSVDGARISNVRFDNIIMKNVDMPIFIRLGARLSTFHPGQIPQTVGSINNIVIRNVTAQASNLGRLLFPTGIFITGIPHHRIGSVLLENISITLSGGAPASARYIHVPENITEFPDFFLFSPYLPAYGMFARHVDDLVLNNVHFKLDNPDARPAILCQDVRHVQWINSAAPVVCRTTSDHSRGRKERNQ